MVKDRRGIEGGHPGVGETKKLKNRPEGTIGRHYPPRPLTPPRTCPLGPAGHRSYLGKAKRGRLYPSSNPQTRTYCPRIGSHHDPRSKVAIIWPRRIRSEPQYPAAQVGSGRHSGKLPRAMVANNQAARPVRPTIPRLLARVDLRFNPQLWSV
jgi:hypothetical protein